MLKNLIKRLADDLAVSIKKLKEVMITWEANERETKSSSPPNGLPLLVENVCSNFSSLSSVSANTYRDTSSLNPTTAEHHRTELPAWIKDLIRYRNRARKHYSRKGDPRFLALHKKLCADVKRAIKEHRDGTSHYPVDQLLPTNVNTISTYSASQWPVNSYTAKYLSPCNPMTDSFQGIKLPARIRDLIRQRNCARKDWECTGNPTYRILYSTLIFDVEQAVQEHRAVTSADLLEHLLTTKSVAEIEKNKRKISPSRLSSRVEAISPNSVSQSPPCSYTVRNTSSGSPMTEACQSTELPAWIRDMIRQRNRARKDWKRTGDPTFRVLYSKLNSDIKRVVQNHRSVTSDDLSHQLFPTRSNAKIEKNNRKSSPSRLSPRVEAISPNSASQSSACSYTVQDTSSCNPKIDSFQSADVSAWIRDLVREGNRAWKGCERMRDPTYGYNKLCADVKRAIEEFRDGNLTGHCDCL